MKLKSRHWSSNNLLSRQSKMEEQNRTGHLKIEFHQKVHLGRTGVVLADTPPQERQEGFQQHCTNNILLWLIRTFSHWHKSCFILTAKPIRRKGFQCNVTTQWKWQQHCCSAQTSTAPHWIHTVNWILILNDISISSVGFRAKPENAGSHCTCAKASGKKQESANGVSCISYI